MNRPNKRNINTGFFSGQSKHWLERKKWNAPKKLVIELSKTDGKQVNNATEFVDGIWGFTWGPS